MPNYQNGKIYTIRCKSNPNLIYVGSTIQLLCKRIARHKFNSKCLTNILLYKTINNNWDDWYIELFENYPCNNKEELHKREGQVIREIGTLNIVINKRTKEEYRNDYKEEIKEYQSKYREENKEKIKERDKKYHEKNRDTILDKHKDYYKNNKEILLEKNKIYREEKKEEIKKKRSEIIKCECGCEITKIHLKRHQKSKKHNDFILK